MQPTVIWKISCALSGIFAICESESNASKTVLENAMSTSETPQPVRDYAMPKQREGGFTLSLASNGGEVDWIARDLLQVSTGDALKFLNDEYLEIRDRYPGDPIRDRRACADRRRRASEPG
jgi:hypothetical protein